MGVLATWMIPWGIKRTREFERHGLSDLPWQKDLKDPLFKCRNFRHWCSYETDPGSRIWSCSACARKVNPTWEPVMHYWHWHHGGEMPIEVLCYFGIWSLDVLEASEYSVLDCRHSRLGWGGTVRWSLVDGKHRRNAKGWECVTYWIAPWDNWSPNTIQVRIVHVTSAGTSDHEK
jgi:hypothetical protein